MKLKQEVYCSLLQLIKIASCLTITKSRYNCVMKKLTTPDIDKVNIGLMILSLIPAFLFPFELFLLVYAILGPLHYLTEINWLHKKQYFTTHKNDYLLIAGFTVFISALIIFKSAYRQYIPLLTFIIFGASLGMVLFKNAGKKIALTVLFAGIGLLLFLIFRKKFALLFSTLMPTLIHVFIFTGLFILLGALKSNNKSGLASLCVFIACAAITLFAGTQLNVATISDYTHNSHSHFQRLNRVLLALFNTFQSPDVTTNTKAPSGYLQHEIPIYFSGTGIKIMRFIAFAYTYHYLNWFSKTSIIQWHNTKKINLIAIFSVWIASVALYIYDYKTGLIWLYLLSFGHVVLEFPLNHISIIQIKQQLVSKFSTSRL